MRTCLALCRSAAELRISISEYLRRIQHAPRLTLAAGVITVIVAVIAHGYAQPGGMPSSLGPTVQRPQTRATVWWTQTSATPKRAQTTSAVQRPRTAATLQRTQTRA